MYVNSSDLNSPVAMETDIPLIEDVQRLKKTVEEGATQVNLAFSLSLFISPFKKKKLPFYMTKSVRFPESLRSSTVIASFLF